MADWKLAKIEEHASCKIKNRPADEWPRTLFCTLYGRKTWNRQKDNNPRYTVRTLFTTQSKLITNFIKTIGRLISEQTCENAAEKNSKTELIIFSFFSSI